MKKIIFALIALSAAFAFFVGGGSGEHVAQDYKVISPASSDPGAGGSGGN